MTELFVENGFPRNLHLSELETTSSTIEHETSLIKNELNFFRSITPQDAIGTLLNSDPSILLYHYPNSLVGIDMLYQFITERPLDLDSEEGFITRFLERQFFEKGTLHSNEEIASIRQKLDSGDYARHFDAYLKYRRRMNNRRKLDAKAFGDYTEMKNDDDVLYNKRVCLSRIVGIETLLQGGYGEVNYQQALISELILNSPFLHSIISGKAIDDEAFKRHSSYLEEILSFARTFDPNKRFSMFRELTSEIKAEWTQEIPERKRSKSDAEYIQAAYLLAGRLIRNDAYINDIHDLLRSTILRRGKIFQAEVIRHPSISTEQFLQLASYETPLISFEDIAGYETQREFYERLAEKIANRDPLVDDIRMVIAAGKPGLGKTTGVMAFLNSLPENARAMIIKGASMKTYDTLIDVAKLHPELQIFAVLEDVDAIMKDRFYTNETKRFLELDSAVEDGPPPNFHIIATTNRPHMLDSALIRPGRTSTLLMYSHPDKKEIVQIVESYADKFKITLTPQLIQEIREKCTGFSPDEIRHVFWLLNFNGQSVPTLENVSEATSKIKEQRELKDKLEQEKVGFKTASKRRPYNPVHDLDEDDDYIDSS